MDQPSVGTPLVIALPKLLGEEVGRCAREPNPPVKDHAASQLLPRRAHLHCLVSHAVGEDDVLKVPVHNLGGPPQQIVQLCNLLAVALLQETQWDHLHLFLVHNSIRLRGLQPDVPFVVRKLHGLHPLRVVEPLDDAPPGGFHPLLVHDIRLALGVLTRFLVHCSLDVAKHSIKVCCAESGVPVRKDAEPDHHVRVCELAAVRGLVLPDEGDGKLHAGVRHERLLREGLGYLTLLHDPKRHAVDLLQHVWEVRGEPVIAQVEHLDVVREDPLVLHHLLHIIRAVHQEIEGLLFGEHGEVLRLQPQVEPLRHQRLHLRLVEVQVQQDDVREGLQSPHLVPLIQDLAQLLEDLLCFGGVLEGDGHPCQAVVEYCIEEMDGESPADGCEVEVELAADGKVEFGLEGVEEEV
eukprot:Sspe_Gene.59298::Locus_32563_Transcript_1_1_Confidence_1.000_Length_6832::g.59298::m.59298